MQNSKQEKRSAAQAKRPKIEELKMDAEVMDEAGPEAPRQGGTGAGSGMMMSKEKPLLHACPVENCDKAYTRRTRLTSHMQVHTGRWRFRCAYVGCTQAFCEKQTYKNHIAVVHLNEKNFKCPDRSCGKMFATRGNLQDHERRHAH